MKRVLSILVLAMLLLYANSYSQCNPQFAWTPAPTATSLLTVNFTNTTIYPTPSATFMPDFQINFGDNSIGYPYTSATHDYAAPGTYTVTFYMTARDSITQSIVCSDSITQQVTVSYPACGATITTVDNGNGSFSFTAVNPANTPGLTYNWNFGDGNTGTGSTVSHAYNSGGNYNVTLQVAGTGCSYSTQTAVNYMALNCDSLTAGFNSSINGLTVYFDNTSTTFPSLNVTLQSNWYFGDGNTSNFTSATHTYANPGSYMVTLINSWVDSNTQTIYCSDSITQQIVVTLSTPLNYISGDIHWDQNAISDSVAYFKVWLIVHDTIANTLTAVDSVIVYPWVGSYTFNNAASGLYLTKAAPSYGNAPIPAYGFVPTYHDSSLYWSGASTIIHAGGITTGRDIWMQYGAPTTGPGFIAGSINQGAGKGTGTGVPNVLVFLRDGSNKMIASTYTNEDGNYTFTNLPIGSYSVYPEKINYATTSASALNVTTGQTSKTDVDFVQTNVEIKPKAGLGIPTVSGNDGIKIYPNPVAAQLFIENKTGRFNQFTITNALGQVIKQEGLKQGNNNIETASFEPGIYYIIINGVDGARAMKIMKK
jgi:PKD repeat protein